MSGCQYFSQDKVDARAGFDNQMAKAALEASDMKEACAVAVAKVCVLELTGGISQ